MKKTYSIRWKVFLYVASFALGIFLLLWLFQTVFLGWFYENTRTNQMVSTADSLTLNIDNEENLVAMMASASQNYDVCTRVIFGLGDDLQSDLQNGCAVTRLTTQETLNILNNTISNDGTYLQRKNETLTINTIFGQLNHINDDNYDLIYSKIAYTQENEAALILVSARMTPVNATIMTIRNQLFYIAIILFIMSIILTFVITSRIAKPLEKMSKSAIALSYGNYDVEFEGSEYREVKELSESLNYAAKKLNEVDQHRRDLIANVSHDLRTPLTMISGYGEMMRDIPGENNSDNAQVIIDESKRLSTLVNDLLDLNKLQEHKLNLNITRFNIHEMLEEICALYQQSILEDDLVLEYANKEEIFVEADSLRIRQVINNFINNAVHYGKEGKLIIVRLVNLDNKVRIEIQDFGRGIAQEQVAMIWDRYYKIDKSHERSLVGSGIGLSIVKEILNLHQVSFGVHSKLDEGSLFYFELNKSEK